jgi:hypothetical protein
MLKTALIEKRKRKGQAVEYLTNNAWAILVVLIGVIALWQMGVFKPPIPERGSMGFSQLKPTDWAVSIENNAYVRIKNNAGVEVKIEAGWITLDVYQVSCNSLPTPATDLYMNPGASRIFIFHCLYNPKISDRFKIGDYYEGDMVIRYTNLDSGSEHTSVGKIFGPIEGPTPFGETTTSTLPGNCGDDCGGQGGTMNATICTRDNQRECSYCDVYTQTCFPGGDCGKPCTAQTEEADCQQTCPWCNTTAPTPVCQQGDCGKQCTVASQTVDCQRGCTYCNPETLKCWSGSSCGNSCSQPFGGTLDPMECTEDCMYCFNYTLKCGGQGDCARPCTPATQQEDCQNGCCYCNPDTSVCEQGDCGRACTAQTESQTCLIGCTHCWGGICAGCGPIVITTTTTTTTTTIPPSDWIIATQIYPKNGSFD